MGRKVSVEITAENNSAAAFQKTISQVALLTKRLEELEEQSNKVKRPTPKPIPDKSFLEKIVSGKSIFEKMAHLNQTAELAKKAWGAVAGTLGAVVRAALDYRSVNDSARADLGKFSSDVQATAARIGDLFVPAVAGVAAAMRPLMAQLRSWLEINGQLIQGGLVDFAVDAGMALSSATATGADLAIRSLRGLNMVISTTASMYHGLSAAALRFAAAAADKIGAPPGSRGALIGQGLRADATRHDAESERLSGAAAAELGKMTSEISSVQSLTDKIAGALEKARGLGRQYMTNAKLSEISTEKQTRALDDAARKAWARSAVDDWRRSAWVQAEKEANAAQLAFMRDGTAQINAMRERDLAKQTSLFERRAAAAERSALLMQAQEDAIYARAADGPASLIQAWDLFLSTRHANTEIANKSILESLSQATQSAASMIISSIADIVRSFRAELGRVGDIETETVQRIAIVAEETTDRYGRHVGERTERYVDSVTQEQIAALEKMGRRAQVVTETVSISTVTTAEAVGAALKAVVNSFAQSALNAITEALVAFGIKKIAEKAAAISSITTAAAEGGAKAAANYAAIPLVGPPLAVAAGTAMSAAIMGFAGLIPFAEGGVVTGGVQGRDSVPALLMPGERVLTVRENAAYEAGARASGQRPPQTAAPASSGAPRRASVQQTFLAFTTSRAQLDRLERDVFSPGRRRRVRNGARQEG